MFDRLSNKMTKEWWVVFRSHLLGRQHRGSSWLGQRGLWPLELDGVGMSEQLFFCTMIGFYQTWTKSLSFSMVKNETWAIVSDNRLRALLLHHILSHLQLIARTNQTNLPTGFVVLWPANFEVSGTALFQLRFFQDQMLKNVCASQLRAAVEIAGAWKIGRNCWKQMLRTRNQLKNCQSSTAFLGPSISQNRSRQSI